jgi:uncharacterized NAD(P)/FAD-binding protein YdhS
VTIDFSDAILGFFNEGSGMTKTVIIVGGGFCGTLAAVHLMRAKVPFALRIVLIDPGEAGRGVAYSSRDKNHLLNVPIGGMSAFANDPDSFLRFAQARYPEAQGSDFIAREFYGDYLQWLLREALVNKGVQCDFSLVRDSVANINTDEGSLEITLASGKVLSADKVLLCTGNGIPVNPAFVTESFLTGATRYVRDPWAPQALDNIDREQPVLLIGCGLTAVDVTLSLRTRNFEQPIHAISRRGLTPLAHRGLHKDAIPTQLPADLLLGNNLRVSRLLRALRRLAADVLHDGGNWRSIIPALRPHLPVLWQHKLSEAERRRFLRHAQIYWDVHRHRLAPVVAASLQDELLTRQLTIHAGRIVSLDTTDNAIDLRWRPRGQSEETLLRVGTVINCTGPCNNVRQSSNPLLQALLKRGVIKQDALGLGIEVADNYQIVGNDERAAQQLYYAGPLLKAKYWEAVAVPELRSHVERATSEILHSLR